MIILADENIAYLDCFFPAGHHIHRVAGRAIDRDMIVRLAPDALLIRSVTRMTYDLLANSSVQFVGSATIGVDHVDLEALQRLNIMFAHAPGCNAQAVAEYVVSAIGLLNPNALYQQQAFCLGVVGYGHVGHQLVHLAQLLNWRVMVCDPLINAADIPRYSLDELLPEVHALSLHVPLTYTGKHATHHLIKTAQLSTMRADALLINSSRGSVVTEADLLNDAKQHPQRRYVLDVFEHEPLLSEALLAAANIATPHIAGYSLEGKLNGTWQIYEQWCQYFKLTPMQMPEGLLDVMPSYCSNHQSITEQIATLAKLNTLERDDNQLRAECKQGVVAASDFDELRRCYSHRRQWQAYGFLG